MTEQASAQESANLHNSKDPIEAVRYPDLYIKRSDQKIQIYTTVRKEFQERYYLLKITKVYNYLGDVSDLTKDTIESVLIEQMHKEAYFTIILNKLTPEALALNALHNKPLYELDPNQITETERVQQLYFNLSKSYQNHRNNDHNENHYQ